MNLPSYIYTMWRPENCGDCIIATASVTQTWMVSCPLTDKLYPRDKHICYNPAQAASWGAESVAHILWLWEGLDPKAKAQRGLPVVETPKPTLVTL